MNMDIFWGLFIPFLGTSLGAACVFFMRGEMHRGVQRGLTGFASGVMVAASIWSLLIPAIEESSDWGEAGFSACGDWVWRRHSFSAFSGSHHSPSSYGGGKGRRAPESSGPHHYAGTGSDAP